MRSFISLSLLLFSFIANAQFVGYALKGQSRFSDWKQDTLFVVKHPEYPMYDEVVAEFLANEWTFNQVAYLDQKYVADKEYRKKNKEKIVLDIVALDSQRIMDSENQRADSPTEALTSLAIFPLEGLHSIKILYPSTILYLNPQYAVAYFSLARKKESRRSKSETEGIFIKDLDSNPIHYQALIALKHLNYLTNITILADHSFVDAKFILSIIDILNKPRQIGKKTLLVSSVHLDELEEADIEKKYGRKYEIATPEEIYKLVKAKDKRYCLLTGRIALMGYAVSVLDLETSEIKYLDNDRAFKLEDDHFKNLKKAIYN
tara:strand:- start:771 stop:1724 length:954 start_codon:yes stop_codon:yes gene_type:complete